MSKLKIKSSKEFKDKFEHYPSHVKPLLNNVRTLIHQTASELESVGLLEETLKWREPSFVTKKGSTIRMDWKEKSPEQYALYFQCTSQLVPTFKALYDTTFNYEGTRAVVFKLEDSIPEEALKDCIAMALEYHIVKKLPLLGR